MKTLLLALLFCTSAFAGTIDRSDCIPKLGHVQDGTFIVSGSETNGKLADEEIELAIKNAPKTVSHYQDAMGRGVFLEVRKTTFKAKSLDDGNYYMDLNAQIDRYCSRSSIHNAKCVDLCILTAINYYERP